MNALDTILSAQNSLIRNWFSYERARIGIFRDMGIMNIDQRGLWEDNFYQQLSGTSAGLVPPSQTGATNPSEASSRMPANSEPGDMTNGASLRFQAPAPLDGQFPQHNEKSDAYSITTPPIIPVSAKSGQPAAASATSATSSGLSDSGESTRKDQRSAIGRAVRRARLGAHADSRRP